jgi:hypothetical protein
MDKQAQGALLDALKVVLYWLLSIASVGLGLYYRKNRCVQACCPYLQGSFPQSLPLHHHMFACILGAAPWNIYYAVANITLLAGVLAVQWTLWHVCKAHCTPATTCFPASCRSKGWTLYKLILGTILCQTAYWSMWAVHNSAVRSVGLGRLTDNLYRICIPLNQLATATFMVCRGCLKQ